MKYARLKDVCEIKKGQSITKQEVIEGDIPVVAGGQQISYFHNVANRDAGIITVSASGAYAGFINYWTRPIFASDCTTIKPSGKDLIIEYLFRILKLRQNEFYKLQKGAGQPHVYGKDFENIEIPLPPLETQKKIADVLDKAQELIDKRKEQIKRLDEFVQSVFYDMFGDPVDNTKNWGIKQVQDVCAKIVGGGTPSKSVAEYFQGNISWVTPKDMKSMYIHDSLDHITEDAIKNSTTNLIPANSMLMVIRSGILKRYIPLAINKIQVAINQDMKAFIVKEDVITVQYLLYFFLAVQHLLLERVRGVTADNIEFKVIKEFPIPLPPLDLQNQFAQIVEKIEQQKSLMQQSLIEMENSFNSIMQRAFRGELF